MHNVECHYAEHHFADRYFAYCHYSGHHFSECLNADNHFAEHTYFGCYCIEGIKMRQLVFRSADIYCQNINNPKMHTRDLFIHERKEGETGKQRERQKKRECECGCIVERRMMVSVIKTDRWKNPLASFGISWKGLPFSDKLF